MKAKRKTNNTMQRAIEYKLPCQDTTKNVLKSLSGMPTEYEQKQTNISYKKHQVNIGLLNETKLTTSIKFNMRNYIIYRQDRDRFDGGVAIIIKHNIPHTRLP